RRMTFDTTAPRGVCVSQDGQTLYVAESSTETTGKRELRAYPILGDGSLGPCAVIHDFGGSPGADGVCLDSKGNLIACAGEPASGADATISVIAPAGTVLETRRLPGARATNCTFGGMERTSLYITTVDGYVYRVANRE